MAWPTLYFLSTLIFLVPITLKKQQQFLRERHFINRSKRMLFKGVSLDCFFDYMKEMNILDRYKLLFHFRSDYLSLSLNFYFKPAMF